MLYAIMALVYGALLAAFHWLLGQPLVVSAIGAGIVTLLCVGAILAMLWYDDVKDLDEW